MIRGRGGRKGHSDNDSAQENRRATAVSDGSVRERMRARAETATNRTDDVGPQDHHVVEKGNTSPSAQRQPCGSELPSRCRSASPRSAIFDLVAFPVSMNPCVQIPGTARAFAALTRRPYGPRRPCEIRDGCPCPSSTEPTKIWGPFRARARTWRATRTRLPHLVVHSIL